MWQDIVVSIANILFVVSLVNQVIYGFKTKKALISKGTSIPTFMGLYAIAISLFTISLFISAGMTFVSATLWLILFIQSLNYKKVEEKK